jgi:3-deoxy-manno-octulosonate cytidylyltransferase (CMP-KDO synthetase)
VDLVVNLQGDAPLTPPAFVEALVDAMARDDVDMATPVLRCDATSWRHFREDRAAGRVGGTTAVFARDGRALYFSKEVIPFVAEGEVPDPIPVFHHVGVYAYRPAALRAYAGWAEGALERHEGLEQLGSSRTGRGSSASRWRRGAGCSGS